MRFKPLKSLFWALLGASSIVFAQNEGPPPDVPQQIGPFGGLNNQDNPIIIPNANAQDLLNVDITPGGRSIKRRHGYGLDAQMSISTAPIHGGYHFYDSSGNDIRLWANDTFVNASVNGAAYTTVVTSITKNATLSCTDSQGLAWCVTTGRDQLFSTNGKTVTFYPSAPQGTEITASPGRLVIANTSANPSLLNFSQQGDFTTWTTGLNTSSAFTENVLGPGSHITHIRYANGRYLWWKDQSFGYLVGDDQFSIQPVIVSYLVGTLDNSSVENEGIVYFRGQDNHIWAYDGAQITRLTREITPITNNSNTRKSNFWLQSTSSDFNSGPSTNVSVFTSSFSMATNDLATFNDPSFEGSPAGSWTQGGGWATFVGQTSKDCGTILPQAGSNFDGDCVSGTFNPKAELINAKTGNVLTSVTLPTSPSCSWQLSTLSSSGLIGNIVQLRFTTNGDGGDILISTAAYVLGGDISLYSNFSTNGANNCIFVDNISSGTSTISSGTYISSVFNAPNLTSWDVLTVKTLDSGGSHVYSMRSSTNSFTASSSTPSWSAVTNNTTVSIATGTFMQFEDTMTLVMTADLVPSVKSITVNWFEGNAADKAYATYFDFGIWWSISYSSATTTNNRILRLDLINGVWTVYDIKSNGFLVQNNKLYIGDPLTGNTYVFGSVENDNGAAINAYWKSKDFSSVGSDFFRGYQPNDTAFNRKDYRTLSTFAAAQSVGTLTVTYTTDRTTSNSYTIQLVDPNGLNIIRHNFNLPFGTKGQIINIQYGNNAVDQPWEVLGGLLVYQPGSWYVYP